MQDRGQLTEGELRRRGALAAGELATALKITQPTVSRLIRRQNGRVVRIGRGRATRYALARDLGGLGSGWPLYFVDAKGKAGLVGMLRSLEAGQWVLQQEKAWETLRGDEFPHGLYPGLPWFLDDLRPQGFLGRAFARRHAAGLGAPGDPRLWDADHVLRALVLHGADLPGAFVLGEQMLAAAQATMINGPAAVERGARRKSYPVLASEALAGEVAGSSAGGEQPKFTSCVMESDGEARQVIVKFTGSAGRPEDERWGDLLAAEQLAGSLLAGSGVDAAPAELIDAGERRFLESRRFDRVGKSGRRGVVSLAALDAAYFGQPYTPWTAAARRLRDDGWITPEDAERLELTWCFGSLIGNSDMHYSNASLFLEKGRPLGICPVYDMLPMIYRPNSEGGLPEAPIEPPPPPPEAMNAWAGAMPLAAEFWGRIAESKSWSGGFRKIAKENLKVLGRHRRHFGGAGDAFAEDWANAWAWEPRC